MKKRLILILASLLITGGGWGLLHARSAPAESSGRTDALPVVSVAPVLVRMVTDTNHFTGYLQAVDTVQLRPRVSGYVESVNFREGAMVKRNQLLFQIDPRPYQAEVARLAAKLVQMRAELVLARTNASRAGRLLEQHALSQEEADRQATAAQSAAAQVAAAAAELDAAQLNLGYTQVRSPIDGRVSNALITQGNLVTSSDILTSVVSVSPVYAYFDVDEQSYLRLLHTRDPVTGKPAGVRVAMALADEDGYPHPGQIDFVDNRLQANSGTIHLRAVFDNRDGAYTPGLYVRMQVEGGKAEFRVLIDDRAVGTDLGNKYVFVVGPDHKVSYRRVDIGTLFDGLRVIKDGLKPDDQVVVNGMQHIFPGIEVKPVPATMTASLTDLERAQIDATASPAGAVATLVDAGESRETRKP
ncbi:efflux RND transporter periplasmic adaptor subunit [Paraburkholderia sp. BCC1885]|uniref:efflux RND transporter periplasmic adaptor subunit n=1 Tax=Paraburkholderia sp. BCC1885 TaxID=2562669 RepID=UPI001182845E|nr:efflux RND transporter periplasmic adaptor subunit [Paraburkholderia sp. BCC1885]